MLHSWAIPEAEFPAPATAVAPFVRGAAVNMGGDGAAHLCFGTSSGVL